MLEEKYTRCPGCATVFRVTPEQLASRGGQVRCGHCKAVFDGNEHQVALATAPGPADAEPLQLEPALSSLASTEVQQAMESEPEGATEPVGVIGGEEIAEVPYEDRFSTEPGAGQKRRRLIAYAVAAVVLVLLIAAQAIYHFRDPIVARWPPSRPMLVRLCDAVGCAIRPLVDDAANPLLSIEATDLQADPAHRGLLILTATLRNHASWALAYPYLELTLTDTQDRVVVRRALAPGEYTGGTVDLPAGIAPNTEVTLKVFIDASATAQAGYRLLLFYP